jgi:hypothetical protein
MMPLQHLAPERRCAKRAAIGRRRDANVRYPISHADRRFEGLSAKCVEVGRVLRVNHRPTHPLFVQRSFLRPASVGTRTIRSFNMPLEDARSRRVVQTDLRKGGSPGRDRSSASRERCSGG